MVTELPPFRRIAVDAARQTAPIETLLFELHVLCPSFPEPLIVRNVNTTATIGELRQRIPRLLVSLGLRSAAESDARLRLIYRGRLLTDDSASMLAVFGEQQMRLSTEHTIHLAISAAEPSLPNTPQPESAVPTPRPTPAVRSSPLLTEAEMQRRIQAHYQRRSHTPQHIPAASPRPAPASTAEHRTQEAVNIIATAMQRSMSGMAPLPHNLHNGPAQTPGDRPPPAAAAPLFAHPPFRIHTPQLFDASTQPTPKMYVLQSPDGQSHGIIIDTSHIKPPASFIPPSRDAAPAPTPTVPLNFVPQDGIAAVNNIEMHINIPPRGVARARPNRALWQQLLNVLWSEVWFVLRLVIFVWWFAGGSSNPYRWFGALSMAVVFIALNAGLFEGTGRMLWTNFVGGIMPLIDAHGRPANAQDAPTGPAQPAGQVPPDPAALAGRLQRRAQREQATWLINTARRLERGLMIFVASLAPGLAEGHIANVEAEAERQRELERRRAEEEEEEERKREAEEKEKASLKETSETGESGAKAADNAGEAEGVSGSAGAGGSATDATTVVNQDAQVPEITA
ncbi:hypothetical protein BROUX41_003688 [Berkeleyomyces rouxiae]|uniref:uncharacterized protein n=1 Tax=Berkeleyomyces rouxiae TaxID=2035830 RepID=UPI003B7754A1